MGQIAVVNITNAPVDQLIAGLLENGVITEEERDNVIVFSAEEAGITDIESEDQVLGLIDQIARLPNNPPIDIVPKSHIINDDEELTREFLIDAHANADCDCTNCDAMRSMTIEQLIEMHQSGGKEEQLDYIYNFIADEPGYVAPDFGTSYLPAAQYVRYQVRRNNEQAENRETIRNTSSSRRSFDLYDAFASNLVGTLDWYGYTPCNVPEEEDAALYDLFIKDFGNGVYGVAELSKGSLVFSQVFPPLSGYTERIAAKREQYAIIEDVSPVGQFYNHEVSLMP
mgnify:CR=1 FL=1